MGDKTADSITDETGLQTVPHASEIVAQENAAAASPDHAEDSLTDILDGALSALKESTKVASERLNAIWNPENRQYEPRAEMVTLHQIINKNLSATMRLKRALRQSQGLPEDD